jgi:hypothetical protein
VGRERFAPVLATTLVIALLVAGLVVTTRRALRGSGAVPGTDPRRDLGNRER